MSCVKLERSRFGTPTPTYYLVRSAVARMSHRARMASLYRLAADIEDASAGASWVVVVDADCVSLELADGTQEEAARGMEVLRGVERR